MFQDSKTAKAQHNVVKQEKFLDGAEKNLQKGKDNVVEKIDSKMNTKTIMNQASTPGISSMNDQKVWAQQPTSKIHNAAAIPTSEILGINRVVKLDIVIEGKEIQHFKHFKLTQSAVKHHEFSLTLSYDTLGSAENHNLEETQNFLGKRITVVFKYKDVIEGPERTFVGVITEVGFSQERGSLGDIVLTGYSPTILLDVAPNIQSFGGAQEVSLNSIADQVIKEGLGQNKYDYRVDSKYGNVPYSSQYEETHYNYLARIAEAYGEQFFYDGEVLHFGKLPPQEKPVKLTYGSSVNDVKIKMKAQHVNPTFYGYNSSKNEKLSTGKSTIQHTSDIAKRAYEISEKTFQTPSLRVAPIKAVSFMDIDASQKGTAGSKASEVFVTMGTTTVPFLYPGCIADIEMRKTDTNDTSYFTKLMITNVIHEVDARGYYDGHFEAIAADTGFIPRPEFEFPKAEPQFAKVISNTDPLNQGRVKVQFDWQNGNSTTEFIRVMSPDAGSSDKVNKNRGFMSVPEVGDQVIVNFVHQHPDRPFVMGGMFHGGIGAGGGAGNNIMSLSSKSGHIIRFNDAGGMEIRDRNGNHVTLSGDGNINTYVSNDSTEDIGNNHTINVATKSTIDVSKGNSIFTMDNAGNVSIKSNTEIKFETGSSSITMDKSGNITIKGVNITIEGTNTKIIGSSLAQIGKKGAETGVSVDSNVTIKGGNIIEN